MESRRTIPSVVHEHAHGAQRKAIALEVWDEDDGVDGNSLHEADGLRPIHRAVLSADTDAVKTLLNADVPADQPTADGRTPIDFTVDLDDVSKVKRTASPKGAMVDVLKKFARVTTPTTEETIAETKAEL